MEASKGRFKMTFANSWWQCIVGLIASYFIARFTIVIALLFGLSADNARGVGYILAIILAIWIARKLAQNTWEKQHRKSKADRIEHLRPSEPRQNIDSYNTTSNKTDKWWYRLLQVAYILFGLLSFAILAMIASDSLPTLDTYASKYSIVCDDGRITVIKNNSALNYSRDDYESAQASEAARFMCSQPPFPSVAALVTAYQAVPSRNDLIGNKYADLIPKNNPEVIPAEKNYSIRVESAVYNGSWQDVVVSAVVGFAILLVLLVLVRATALYILFKEPFLRNLFGFWKKRILPII